MVESINDIIITPRLMLLTLLITPCIVRTLYLLNKFILHQHLHYIAKVLFHYTCCCAGRGVCQGVVDNGWYRTL